MPRLDLVQKLGDFDSNISNQMHILLFWKGFIYKDLFGTIFFFETSTTLKMLAYTFTFHFWLAHVPFSWAPESI